MSYAAVFAAGILTAIPLICEYLFFLPWISLIPLFLAAERKKSAYRHGLVFSLGYYGTVYYWFTCLYPLDFAGFSNGVSILLIITAWVGCPCFRASEPPSCRSSTVSCTVRTSRFPHRLSPPPSGALWNGSRRSSGSVSRGQGLAVTQYKILPAIQSASLLGSLFTGFLIVTVNGFLALSYKKLRAEKKPGYCAAVAAGIVAVNFVFGVVRLSVYKENGDTVKAACIQGNIASGDKWADDSLENSLRIYVSLTERAVEEEQAELVVWPETVITTYLNLNPYAAGIISDLAKEKSITIAVGAFYTEDGNNYNSIYLFHPDGSVDENVYCKRHLVPFGEYLPMPGLIKAVLPFLAEMNMFSDALVPGTSSELFETEHGKIGGLVCFDSIYETLTLSSVRDGANLMILSTNDSWYRDSAAVYQHNGHAVLRAVESGRCFVRAANTGISSVISAKGEIKTYLEPLVDGYVAADVTFSTERTPYSCVGDLIVWLSFAFLAVTAVIEIAAKIKAIRRKD